MSDEEQIPPELQRLIQENIPLGAQDHGQDPGESYPAPSLPAEESARSAGADYPLRIKRSGTAGIVVLAGSVGGFSIAEASSTITATTYVSVSVTMSYNPSTGIWSATGATLNIAGAYASPSSGVLVVQIGSVTAGRFITQVAGGNQWVARTGSGSTYVDANGSISPLNP